MEGLSADTAFSLGLFAGWLALVVAMVWPEQKHCTCCAKRQAKENEENRRP